MSLWSANSKAVPGSVCARGPHELGALTCLTRSGLTVVWGCRMLTGSVFWLLWGISRTFSAMKSCTLLRASTVPWIRHTRSVVPGNTNTRTQVSSSLSSNMCTNTQDSVLHRKHGSAGFHISFDLVPNFGVDFVGLTTEMSNVKVRLQVPCFLYGL